MPSHTHATPIYITAGNHPNWAGGGGTAADPNKRTAAAGGGGAHNNIQPSISTHTIIKT